MEVSNVSIGIGDFMSGNSAVDKARSELLNKIITDQKSRDNINNSSYQGDNYTVSGFNHNNKKQQVPESTFDVNGFMQAIQNMLSQNNINQSNLFNGMLQNYNTNYTNMFNGFNDSIKNAFGSFNNSLNNMSNKNNQNWANYLTTNRDNNYLNNAMQYYKSNNNVNKTFNNSAQNNVNNNYAIDIWKDKL